MISKSGDRDFDYALAQTLAKLSTVFDVLPGFSYYDDADSENAYATPVVKQSNADGTVLFGIRLLKTLMRSQESPEVAVAAVCAHEFGHIVQFKHKLDTILGAGQPTVKRLELQADFFAGYFAGVRRREKPDFPAAVFAMTQYKNGDVMTAHPGHHGTPAERGKAIEEGFVAAYSHKKSFVEAITYSTSYVKSL